MKTKFVSIIIVYYKEMGNLINLLISIKSQVSGFDFEVIVVDNSKERNIKENIIKVYKNVVYLKSPRNLGYSAGNNFGTKYAKGEYIFILNPDIRLEAKVIERLASFLVKEKNAAIVAPELIDSTGKIVSQIAPNKLTPIRYVFTYTFIEKIFPENKIKKMFLKKIIKDNGPYRVDVVPGSAFMIKKNIFEELNGFDEKFYLYFEDNDICDRTRRLGYEIYKIPSVKVFHDWLPADGNVELKIIFEKSRYYYFKKHFGTINAIVVELFAKKWWRVY